MRSARRSNSRIVAVLGMHRSGTSWLTGSLQQAGLALGDVNEFAPHNQRGNREHEGLQRLHEKILVDNGGSWDAPPTVVTWQRSHRRSVADVVTAMDTQFPVWGFKDPRALLMLHEWRDLVGERLEFIGIFRKPLRVTHSLAARPGGPPIERGIQLWNRYNEALISAHRIAPFPLIEFDAADQSLLAFVRRLAADLGLSAPDAAGTFFEAEFAHMEAFDDIPPTCTAAWDYLSEHRRVTMS